MPRRSFTKLHDAIDQVMNGTRLRVRSVGTMANAWLVNDLGGESPVTMATYRRMRARNLLKLESRDGADRIYCYLP